MKYKFKRGDRVIVNYEDKIKALVIKRVPPPTSYKNDGAPRYMLREGSFGGFKPPYEYFMEKESNLTRVRRSKV